LIWNKKIGEKNEKRTGIEGVGIEGCVVMNMRYACDSYIAIPSKTKDKNNKGEVG